MKRILIYIFFNLLFLNLLTAQDATFAEVELSEISERKFQKTKSKADSLFARGAYKECLHYYKELEQAGRLDNQSKCNMAESYSYNADYKLAEYWYKQFVTEGTDANTCLNFAKVLQINNKCKEAAVWYKRYLATDPKNAADIEFLTDCRNLKAISYNEEVVLYNLEELNTTASEYSVMSYLDDLVFTSNRALYKVARHEDQWTESEFSDLFTAKADEFGVYTKVNRLKGSVNKKFNDGVSAFDKNEYRMFYSRNEIKTKGGRKFRQLELYTALINEDGSWYNIKKMPINAEGFSSCHPAISEDGKTLVFASDRPGGLGGMDLYVSYKVDDEWTEPKNMGGAINSSDNEIFPTISFSNAIYFASDGHVGLGGLDIFKAHHSNGQFESKTDWIVQNLGRPFNSTRDDFSFTVSNDQLSGYMASNREGGMGKDDIYRWVQTKEDPLVLNWYTKSFCINQLYRADDGSSPIVTMLEFVDHDAVHGKDDVFDGSLIEDLDQDSKLVVEDIVNYRRKKLANIKKFKADDPDYESIKLLPSADYLFVMSKDGFFNSRELFTVDQNSGNETKCLEFNLEPFRELGGKITKDDDKENLEHVEIVLFNKCDGYTEIIETDRYGEFTHTLRCDCEYELSIEQEGYETYRRQLEKYEEECQREMEPIDIELKSTNPYIGRLRKGEVFILNNIFYDYNSAELTQEAQNALNHLVTVMTEYPSMKIHLSSFTDSRGKKDYNMELSTKRSQSAAMHLFTHGIDETRVQFIGMGENKLLNDCGDGVDCTEDEHQKNRRTEVKITSI
ncbi:MAG: OmpA family protein [Bacteroidia bacterium]|nr:OmpA family protein [Bacteroidia bacterium]